MLKSHQKELSTLRGEKESMDNVLTIKTMENKKTLEKEMFRLEEEMKRYFDNATNETNKMSI